MARRRRSEVINPNLGLFLGRPSIGIPERGLRDCLNVRIRNQAIVRDNLGWLPFPLEEEPLNLDGKPVLLIDNFFPRAGGQFLIFGNTTDLFIFREGPQDVAYLTPRYETGTVAVTNSSTTVTGDGTSWNDNVKQGDAIHIGNDGEVEPSAQWYEVAAVTSDTELELTEPYQGGTDSGLDYTVRQTFTAGLGDYWDTSPFYSAEALTVGSDGDRWYATNGVDRVVAWGAGMDQVYRPDLGDLETCRFVYNNQNIMMYGGIRAGGDERPFSIKTSAIGRPEEVVNLEAAEFKVHGLSDAILQAYTIGESTAIYGTRSVTLAQFVGPPLMFVFRTVIDGIGPRSGRAIADFGDYHKWVGPDTQYVFDGVSVRQSNNHVWQDLVRRLSPQRMDMLIAHFDEEEGELIWVVPQNTDADTEGGSPEQAYVEHYLEDVEEDNPRFVPHTRRELPATAFGFFERVATLTFDQIAGVWSDQNYRWNDQFYQAAFPLSLFGTEDGRIMVASASDAKAGAPMLSYARFGRRAIGAGADSKGIIRRIYPMVETLPEAGHDLGVIVRVTNTAAGNMSSPRVFPYSLRQDTSRHFVSPMMTGRFVEVEFRTNGAGHIWTLVGYDIDLVPGGKR
jgi:hypothetical protein